MSHKQEVTIGILGHVDHGKTTLITAMAKLLKTEPSFAAKVGCRSRDVLVHVTDDDSVLLRFPVGEVEYTVLDLPACHDWARELLSGGLKLDCAILVTAGTDGPMPQTRESIELLRCCGVEKIMVFLSKRDLVADEELIELIEMDVRELLAEYDYDGDSVPVLAGSVQKVVEWGEAESGHMLTLLECMQSCAISGGAPEHQAFRMQVEQVFRVKGMGVAAVGRIADGTVSVGSSLELYGGDVGGPVTVAAIEMARSLVKTAGSGDNVGLFLSGVGAEHAEKGQYLAEPKSLCSCTSFEGEVYVCQKSEGGRATPFFNGKQAYLVLGSHRVLARYETEKDVVMPGDHQWMKIRTAYPVGLRIGDRFDIMDQDVRLAAGVVAVIRE